MDIETLSAHIKPLDLSVKPGVSASEQEYFRHFKINIEETFTHINHFFGHFATGRFDIVVHYFQNEYANKTCFILHGYYDHSGLYSHVIEHCIKKGFSVVIYDLPGHGLSTGKQACIRDFEDYKAVLEDVVALFEHHAPKPWNVIAQSTGAAVLMDFLLNDGGHCFSKAVLLAPLVQPVHWRYLSLLYEVVKVFLKQVPRTFSTNSNEERFLDFLKGKDPLQARHLSMRWVGSLKRWITYFKQLNSSDQPVLVIQGQQDGTVDWRHNIPVIKTKFPSAKVLYLKDGRHHLANEREDIRVKIFSAIDMYFDATANLPGSSTPLN